MKKMYFTLIIATVLLSIFGCTQKHSDQLTRQQIEQIKSELKAVCDSFDVKWAELDDVGALKYYSTDMKSIDSSSLSDFQGEKRLWEGVKDIATMKIEPIYLDFIVLTKDLAISAWVNKLKYVMKSGDTLQINKKAYTKIWKKSNGQWKIIYEHGSSFN